MVNGTLQKTVDALDVEDRASLLEYLERTTDLGDATLTHEQVTVISRRDADMDADPTLGIPADEFIARLRAKWL